MSGHDLVRVWKDADERGEAAHPSGEVDLTALSGGAFGMPPGTLGHETRGCCPLTQIVQHCGRTQFPMTCPIPMP